MRPRTLQHAAPDRPTTPRGIASSTKEQKKSGRPTGNYIATHQKQIIENTHTKNEYNGRYCFQQNIKHAQFAIVLRIVFVKTGLKKQVIDTLLISAVYDRTPSQQGTATAAHTLIVQSTSCTVVAGNNKPAYVFHRVIFLCLFLVVADFYS